MGFFSLYLGILRLTRNEHFFRNNGANFVKEEPCKKGLEAWKHMLIIIVVPTTSTRRFGFCMSWCIVVVHFLF